VIVEAVLSALAAVIEGLLALLPEAGDLSLDGFGVVIGAFKAFNVGLPVTEALALGAVQLVVIGGIFVTRLFLTLWHAIPGKFT